jgi:hypothetical protein
MKILSFSLFEVLIFKVLAKNKLDRFFEAPSAFSLEEKAGKKNIAPRFRFCFSGTPVGLKNRRVLFSWGNVGQEKRTKKEPVRENKLVENWKKIVQKNQLKMVLAELLAGKDALVTLFIVQSY